MKVAFLGNAHIHTQDYARACLDDPRVTIVGAAAIETTPYAFPADVALFEHADELPDHDLCVVTSDIASHPELVDLVRAPHVFVEKPLGVSEDRARTVAGVIERSGARFHTGLFLRHGDPVRRLRDLLRTDTVGAVHSIELRYAHPGLTDGWLRDWSAHMDPNRMGYGVFGDLAAHLIDLVRWCGGPDGGALTVDDCDLKMVDGIDAAGTARLRSSSGFPVSLGAGALAAGRELTLRFVCEKGTLAIENDALVRTGEGEARQVLTEPADLTPKAGFEAELNAIAEGRSSEGATLDDMIAVNAVLDALYALARRSNAAQL